MNVLLVFLEPNVVITNYVHLIIESHQLTVTARQDTILAFFKL